MILSLQICELVCFFLFFFTCCLVKLFYGHGVSSQLADQIRDAGIVGAGGGGFPAHIKLLSPADTIIVNGAECEPLLHKDAALMETKAAELVRGLLMVADTLGAKRAFIGVKAKNKEAVEACQAACEGTIAKVHLLGDLPI